MIFDDPNDVTHIDLLVLLVWLVIEKTLIDDLKMF
jgi:hypothetical protein